MDVDAVADELYGLAPNAFTPRRDALVKQARSAGDREAAAEIAALRKPTVVAWLANQLARRSPEAIAPLLELGQALREATTTLAGPELRALSSQRAQLVHTLVEQARFLGQEEGQRVTEDAARGLEDTFSAALADPAAAQALGAGRLVAGLSHQGYGAPQAGDPSDASGAGTRQPPAARQGPAPSKPSAEQQRRARERSQVEHDLGEAWGQARRAADARDKAAAGAEQAQRARADAERKAARLRGELESAEADLSEAVRQDDAAQMARDEADHEAQSARQHVAELQRRLDGLQES